MTDKKPTSPNPRRRQFLRAAGGAGALATLAVAASDSAAAPAPATPAASTPTTAQAAGYHDSAHIQEYYRTAAYW